MENLLAAWLILGIKQLLHILDWCFLRHFGCAVTHGTDEELKLAENSYDHGAQVVRIVLRGVGDTTQGVTPDNFLFFHER